ncbi:MAG TPA: transglycosylase SLT domain-containing protein [Acidimicrobiales bacterium]|nr:transglycosylase SLT domain-containing protein [Acidimicrobiales bacterium]
MRRLLVLLGLVVASCSSDGDDATPPSTTTTTEATTTTSSTTTTTLPPGPPVAATSPAGLAAQVAAAEAAVRDPATPPAALERAAHEAQVAYRAVAEKPEWLDQVAAAVPAELRATVRANVTAGIELRALTKPRTALPPWEIVAPAPADELLGYYREAERQVGVPWQYLAAIHLSETRMGRIRGTSSAGAQGPMQFMPATWEQYGQGGDINSNRDAILAAARLLKRNGAPDNMANALFNYNRSQRYVRAVTAYAEQMKANERAYYGYYHWQVYYRLVEGDRHLPVGYKG